MIVVEDVKGKMGKGVVDVNNSYIEVVLIEEVRVRSKG